MRQLTPRIALEIAFSEGLAREAYRDSQGVWTWSIGVTDASGHRVFPRYRDAPQTLEQCLAVYRWLLETRYLPPVLAAFAGHEPSEAELGAALSFHWNTGAIGTASWIARFLAGDRDGARAAMLEWAKPASLIARRRREAALFFDGTWSADGTVLAYEIAKPAYRPAHPQRIDLAATMGAVFAEPGDDPVRAPPAALPEPSPSPAAAPPNPYGGLAAILGDGPVTPCADPDNRARLNWFSRLFVAPFTKFGR